MSLCHPVQDTAQNLTCTRQLYSSTKPERATISFRFLSLRACIQPNSPAMPSSPRKITMSIVIAIELSAPVLQCFAVCCSVTMSVVIAIELPAPALQCVEVCCSVLHCEDEFCLAIDLPTPVLQCVAACCGAAMSIVIAIELSAPVLQCVAVCCSVLQCAAV